MPVTDRLRKAWGAGGIGATQPADPGSEAARIRGGYIRRLGIARPSQPQEASPLPSLLRAAAMAEEGKEEAPDEGPENETFQVNTIDRICKEDFRVNFLRNLSYKGVLLPPALRPPRSQTVILFDWDDTLLCTSFLSRLRQRPLSALGEQLIHNIAKLSQQLLETARRSGQTFIITNAMDGWVEHSAATWVPELLPVLRTVRIISARTRFEADYPGEEHQWKVQAFLEVQRQLHSEVVTNLLAIGDSNHEMHAVCVMGKQFANALIKTIKLQQDPTPDDLQHELVLVLQKFERIVSHHSNMQIFLERHGA